MEKNYFAKWSNLFYTSPVTADSYNGFVGSGARRLCLKHLEKDYLTNERWWDDDKDVRRTTYY
jgi:hypothetical protein